MLWLLCLISFQLVYQVPRVIFTQPFYISWVIELWTWPLINFQELHLLLLSSCCGWTWLWTHLVPWHSPQNLLMIDWCKDHPLGEAWVLSRESCGEILSLRVYINWLFYWYSHLLGNTSYNLLAQMLNMSSILSFSTPSSFARYVKTWTSIFLQGHLGFPLNGCGF